MARGWESKSVEEQIDLAQSRNFRAVPDKSATPAQLATLRRKESIELSRVRVKRELAAAHNPRYKAQLNKALEDLEAQLSTFGAAAG
jgi:hypothetical protein